MRSGPATPSSGLSVKIGIKRRRNGRGRLSRFNGRSMGIWAKKVRNLVLIGERSGSVSRSAIDVTGRFSRGLSWRRVGGRRGGRVHSRCRECTPEREHRRRKKKRRKLPNPTHLPPPARALSSVVDQRRGFSAALSTRSLKFSARNKSDQIWVIPLLTRWFAFDRPPFLFGCVSLKKNTRNIRQKKPKKKHENVSKRNSCWPICFWMMKRVIKILRNCSPRGRIYFPPPSPWKKVSRWKVPQQTDTKGSFIFNETFLSYLSQTNCDKGQKIDKGYRWLLFGGCNVFSWFLAVRFCWRPFFCACCTFSERHLQRRSRP